MAALRLELFRTLLLQKVEFFDRHNTTELTSLLSVELDNVRSFVFGNVSRDRGLRAILEASGSVLVLFVLSWRLGPVMGLSSSQQLSLQRFTDSRPRRSKKRNSTALSHMVGVADQAFAAIRTVRSAPWRKTPVACVLYSVQLAETKQAASANIVHLHLQSVLDNDCIPTIIVHKMKEERMTVFQSQQCCCLSDVQLA